MIEAGRYAPSGSNSQSTHFIVLADQAKLREIAGIVQDAFAAMEIEAAWGKGSVTVRPILDSFSEVGELARYLTKERPEVGDRGFIPSVGLARPKIESERVTDGTALDLPPGCYVMDRREIKNEYGEYQYIKYYLLEDGETAPMRYPKF